MLFDHMGVKNLGNPLMYSFISADFYVLFTCYLEDLNYALLIGAVSVGLVPFDQATASLSIL